MIDYFTYYREHIELVFPPLVEADHLIAPSIMQVEQQLNITLPQSLRSYYLLTGNRADINASQNVLIPPDSLAVNDEMIVFYRENQSVFLWSIHKSDLHLDDPPVYMTDNTTPFTWKQTNDLVSFFLVSMAYYQASIGGLPYVGVATLTNYTLPLSITAWERIPLASFFAHTMLFIHPGKVICAVSHGNLFDVYAGGRTREDFLEINNLLGVQWDYSTLDEDSE